MRLRRFFVWTLTYATLAACTHSVAVTSPAPASGDALLILPGFGYDRGAQKNFRALGKELAAAHIDVFAPKYIERGGLNDTREEFLEFYRDQHLERYARLHVFAFIAGAWTLNPVIEQGQLKNVRTIIYDRSPLQERAPRIADERLHFFTWLRYGKPVFELAHTPYTPMRDTSIRVGIMVETRPTSLVRRYERMARSYGPFDFACGAFGQRFDDCIYVPLTHDEMYSRFLTLKQEILSFILSGKFSVAAERKAPTHDPFAK